MRYDSIIWDFDGTLFDTYPAMCRDLRRTMEGLGFSFTEEELLEDLNQPEVSYHDDGTVWVYWEEQAMEITDRFDEDGVCFLQLKNGEETMYLTIQYEKGYAMSSFGFVQPEEFN